MNDTLKPYIQLKTDHNRALSYNVKFTLIKVIFSEELIEFNTNSFSIENGTISNFRKISNLSYSFQVKAKDSFEGNLIINIKEDSVHDLVGNGNIAISITKKIDTKKPEILETAVVNFRNNYLKPIISGNCSNGDRVTAFINSERLEPKSLCINGKYSIEPLQNIEEGIYDLTVVAEDSLNNISNKSSPYRLILDITPPTKPTIDIVAEDDIINSIDRKDGVVLKGISEVNSTIFLKINDKELTLLTISDGSWVYLISENDIPVVTSTLNIELYAKDSSNNKSEVVNKEVKIILTKPTISINTPIMEDDYINGEESKHFNISGQSSNVEEGQKIIIKIGDLIFSDNIDENGNWEITDKDLSSLSDERYAISVNLSDNSKNVANSITANIIKNSKKIQITITDNAEKPIINKEKYCNL